MYEANFDNGISLRKDAIGVLENIRKLYREQHELLEKHKNITDDITEKLKIVKQQIKMTKQYVNDFSTINSILSMKQSEVSYG